MTIMGKASMGHPTDPMACAAATALQSSPSEDAAQVRVANHRHTVPPPTNRIYPEDNLVCPPLGALASTRAAATVIPALCATSGHHQQGPRQLPRAQQQP
eukprot:CAMPEP_0202882828 /NCGR_PEP_ID=MMETSP1391-20130828/38554_1 /ASSEMBLY_ACC=CAM_ASM_000867 /TAXON_ID=1034604 /ORGANISM="Chlamydomonas leiostraca, Strain SAG 11-49" /LENGTH=99 /DNA_ID=CAMNT_0049565751 /DNA_START=122 /DNA_END=421 /DNA_ORIENTATION=-